MFRSPLFWRCCLMPGAASGWLFAAVGLIVDFAGPVRILWIVVLLIWTIIHPLEIVMSYRIGKKKNLSTARIVAMTIIFGFTWWLPLKMGIIDR